jgi:hypothetical protein
MENHISEKKLLPYFDKVFNLGAIFGSLDNLLQMCHQLMLCLFGGWLIRIVHQKAEKTHTGVPCFVVGFDFKT